MANLITTKEKYGVSVAARIQPKLAHAIMERAEGLGISFAKMVGMLISKGFDPQDPMVTNNSEEVEVVRSTYRETIAEFIKTISDSDEEHTEFVKIFNNIYQEIHGSDEG